MIAGGSGEVPDDVQRTDARVPGSGEELDVGRLQSLFGDWQRIATGFFALLGALAAVYVLLPRIVGLDDALDRIDDATWPWLVAALAFNVGAFAAYVMLFRGVLVGVEDPDGRLRRRLGVRASYQITMAGLAATRLFSAAGAGGLVLTYWALRRAGVGRRVAAARMVAFLVVTYSVYAAAVIVCGLALHFGLVAGAAPLAGTLIPALFAIGAVAVCLLVALIPEDIDRRLAALASRPRTARIARRLASVPATVAEGVRAAIEFAREPRRGALALGGAAGFWAANIAVLWACFRAYGGSVEPSVLVQGFFLGMFANVVPSPAAGAGPVDAGMIAAFAMFGLPAAIVFPAVLVYRLIAFWLPVPLGLVAYLQLRRTVTVWEREDDGEYPAVSDKVTTAEAR
ncbi:MAG: flippase-like domain-containing protein [Thermoleophilum sp.]|nr:flippase-like domain-containing protein [Thermoleophilum sp.]